MFAPVALAGLELDALANINGPSVLRMPDWAAGKQAAFHMYFGHHKGKSLRLAYADRLEGPWAMHPDPVIPLADSLFAPEDPAPGPGAAPLPSSTRRGTPIVYAGASPIPRSPVCVSARGEYTGPGDASSGLGTVLRAPLE